MKFGLQEHDSSSDEASDSPLPPQPLRRSVRVTPARPKPPHASSSSSTPKEPFNPTPVRLVRPPSLKASHFRPRSLAPPSPASSSAETEDLLSSSDDDDPAEEDEDDSDFDSEEEAWPVGPVNSVGIGGWRRPGASASAYKGKGRAADFNSDPPKLYGAPDALDAWDDKARASSWAAANRTFRLSLARSKSLSPALAASRSSSSAAAAADMSSIQGMLSQLALQQKEEAAALVRSFEQRNAALWDSIEASIRAAEAEEGERQRVLAEARRREEEAERRAKEMREAEERKAEEERKRAAEEEKEKAARRAEEEKKDAEDKAERAEEERAAAAKASALGLQSGDAEGSPEAEFKRWTAKMQHIKQAVLPVVSQNLAWRKACYQAKRAITPKIGQLTSSSEAIARIIAQLDDVLKSMRAPAPTGPGAPEPYTWTLNHLAKALVKQAETEVTAKLGTAYPLGRVVVGLLLRGHAELGDVLMARLVKKCFWITAHWPRKLPDQTDEAHQKMLGHAPPSSSETLVQYAERMSGLVALYGAIVQTSPLSAPQGPPPSPSVLANVPAHFRPAAGWRWFVLMLRAPLVGLEPAPLLLVTFLEVAGEALLEVYGRQMHKALEVLLREGVRGGKAGFSEKARSSSVRLLLWLEEWEKTGKAECAKGREVDP
ncbi:Nuclear pore complex nucleoporin component [Rhodotorula kratochvilovae]